MSNHDPAQYALSGSINISEDSDEAAFRLLREEVCDEYARSEGTRLPGQLTRIEYAVAVIAVIAAFVGVLLSR